MMAQNWPPRGSIDPKAYEKNESVILLMMAIATVLFGVLCEPLLTEGSESFVQAWLEVATTVGLTKYPLFFAMSAVGVAIIGVCLVWLKLIIPVHERIHYEVGEYYDLNPEYGYDESRFFSNPCVTAMSTGITIRENIVMLAAPFLLIGMSSVAVMFLSHGIVAGLAAFVFVSNSAGSAQDLYHVGRLLRMPAQTKFANFEEGDEIRTEYVYPK